MKFSWIAAEFRGIFCVLEACAQVSTPGYCCGSSHFRRALYPLRLCIAISGVISSCIIHETPKSSPEIIIRIPGHFLCFRRACPGEHPGLLLWLITFPPYPLPPSPLHCHLSPDIVMHHPLNPQIKPRNNNHQTHLWVRFPRRPPILKSVMRMNINRLMVRKRRPRVCARCIQHEQERTQHAPSERARKKKKRAIEGR